MPTTLFILAGEASGDHHGAKLIRELKARDPSLRIVGMGGPKMAAAGLDVAKDLAGMQVVGFWEVAKQYGFFRRVYFELLDRLKQEHPAALICIDYPGFNLRFAQDVRKLGIPVLYYIVPQVWAWKERRAKAMARYIDKAFCVFEFEPPFFDRFGLKTEFVGHPLMDDAPLETPPRADARTVALLPGSRRNEIEALCQPMCHAVAQVRAQHPDLRALVSLADGAPLNAESKVRAWLRNAADTQAFSTESAARRVVADPDPELPTPAESAAPHSALLPRLADFAFVKSGTSTLEAGLAGNPLCVVYKASALSYAIAHLLVNIPVFSLVNIVLGRYAVPELLQEDVNPARLARELERGLFDERYRDRQKAALAELPARLGGPGASGRAAQRILDFIAGRP
jgi:lipid-A-disaccharide synthase